MAKRWGFFTSLLALLPLFIFIPLTAIWKHYGQCNTNISQFLKIYLTPFAFAELPEPLVELQVVYILPLLLLDLPSK